MEQVVEQLLRSPKLDLYFQQIGEVLAKERAARQRFYDEVKEGDKAEFINGEAIIHSPIRLSHDQSRKRLSVLVDTYVGIHRLGMVGGEKLMISLTRNDYEPDICYWRPEKATHFTRDQMRFPAPDWIVEVLSPSTEAVDRGIKFEDYAAHGVAEYWIVDPEKQLIEQYATTSAGAYELRLKSNSGIIRSSVIAGFEIPIAAVFADAENLRVLKTLLV
jgi:Uma2 family endonuclease